MRTFFREPRVSRRFVKDKELSHETASCFCCCVRPEPCRDFGIGGDDDCAARPKTAGWRDHSRHRGLWPLRPPRSRRFLSSALELPARLAYGPVWLALLPQLVSVRGEGRLIQPSLLFSKKAEHQLVILLARLQEDKMPGIRDHLGARF